MSPGTDRPDPEVTTRPEPGSPGSGPVQFTAVVCGPAADEAWAVTTASLVDGTNGRRLAGIIERDRIGGAAPVPSAGPGSGDPAPGLAEADGSHLLFVPAGGVVVDGALDRLADEVGADPEADVLYVDDVGFTDGAPSKLTEPAHRPGFSPDRLRAQMYLGEMVAVRRELAADVDPDGTTLRAPLAHDRAVVLTDRARAVVHVPEILFHRRLTIDLVDRTGTPDALNRVLAEQGFPAEARAAADGVFRLEPRLRHRPPVSVVIPTNGSSRTIGGEETVLVHHAIDSLLSATTYPDYELVIVISPGGPPDLISRLRSLLAEHRSRAGGRFAGPGPSIRFCSDQRPFNFSNASNRGAVHASGDVLVFLNDDTRVVSPDWLERLVMYAGRPDVGAVGARLLYEDGSVQHTGIWTRGGHPTHRYDGFPGDHAGYLSAMRVPQNCLAVTGACLAVESAKFTAVGGFSPRFPGSYNDVDLCLKLMDRGHRTVVDPDTVLVHYGSSTRDPGIEDWELAVLHERWRSVLNDDPYDNPHHVAPLSDEFPPPDATVSEHRRVAGLTGHRSRRWPRPPMLTGFRPAVAGTAPAGIDPLGTAGTAPSGPGPSEPGASDPGASDSGSGGPRSAGTIPAGPGSGIPSALAGPGAGVPSALAGPGSTGRAPTGRSSGGPLLVEVKTPDATLSNERPN